MSNPPSHINDTIAKYQQIRDALVNIVSIIRVSLGFRQDIIYLLLEAGAASAVDTRDADTVNFCSSCSRFAAGEDAHGAGAASYGTFGPGSHPAPAVLPHSQEPARGGASVQNLNQVIIPHKSTSNDSYSKNTVFLPIVEHSKIVDEQAYLHMIALYPKIQGPQYPQKMLAVTQYQVAELLGEAYAKAATIENAVNGFRAAGVWPVNRHVFKDSDFVASETVTVRNMQADQNNNTSNPNNSDSEDDNIPLSVLTTTLFAPPRCSTPVTPNLGEESSSTCSQTLMSVSLNELAPLPTPSSTLRRKNQEAFKRLWK
ncbi:hypothetical protein QE152_g39032 [Popillia japonica]|uniref:Uncharacterized protein n=1 Tax=Popillia japonica TaxID=7064 RepID=A0AAW1HUU7_POPJA